MGGVGPLGIPMISCCHASEQACSSTPRAPDQIEITADVFSEICEILR